MKIGNHLVKSESLLLRFSDTKWEELNQAQLIKICLNLIGELDCEYENSRTYHQAYIRADGQIRAMQVGLYEI